MKAREYYGFSGWARDPRKKCWEDQSVGGEFETDVGPEPQFVYALYNYGSCEGDADVVFKKDGKWFLVSGSHCSCYGLEGQWEPEEIDPAVHFKGLQSTKGKRLYLAIHDTQGDFPEATQHRFNEWLVWAVAHDSF